MNNIVWKESVKNFKCLFVGYEGGVVEEYNIKANSLAESQGENIVVGLCNINAIH